MLKIDTIAETAKRVAAMNAANPFHNRKRFAIQVWKGGERSDYYAPSLGLADTMLRTLADPSDPDRAEKVTVFDNVTCLRVRDLHKSAFGYRDQRTCER